MIDISSEKLLTLEQAADKLLVSERIITKWIRSGSKGVRLEAIKFGIHWRTSEEALQRFGDRQTPNQETSPAVPTITPNQRQRQNEAAKAALELAFGVRRCETCKEVIDTHKRTIPKNEKLWCPQCLIRQPATTFGQRLRSFRWGAAVSQDELVAKTGISLQIIRAYERNKRMPTDVHLVKLIEVFGNDLVSGMKANLKDGADENRAST